CRARADGRACSRPSTRSLQRARAAAALGTAKRRLQRAIAGMLAPRPTHSSGEGPTSPRLRSSHRRCVDEAALAPQVVGAARQLQYRLRADVALEDLAIVADRLDRAIRPILVETEQLAGVFRRAEDALHDRVLAVRLLLVDVGLREAVFLGFDQRVNDPLDVGK